MATIDELLDGAVVSEDINELIYIDPVKRALIVPTDEITIGVVNDKNAECKFFSMPKVVGNNIAVEVCNIRILYRNAEGEEGFSPAKEVASNDDAVVFCWEVPPKATRYAGGASFSVCLCYTEGGEDKEWHTTSVTGSVLPGLNCNPYTSDETEVPFDVYLETFNKANEATELAAEARQIASEALEGASGSAAAAEQQAIIAEQAARDADAAKVGATSAKQAAEEAQAAAEAAQSAAADAAAASDSSAQAAADAAAAAAQSAASVAGDADDAAASAAAAQAAAEAAQAAQRVSEDAYAAASTAKQAAETAQAAAETAANSADTDAQAAAIAKQAAETAQAAAEAAQAAAETAATNAANAAAAAEQAKTDAIAARDAAIAAKDQAAASATAAANSAVAAEASAEEAATTVDTRFGGELTAEGDLITLTDQAEKPHIKQLTIYGKSTQDGTPTPDAPVDIVSVGADGSLVQTVTGKNLIPYPYEHSSGATLSGITYTVADDGSITATGTSTGVSVFRLRWDDRVPLPPGTYAISDGVSTSELCNFAVIRANNSYEMAAIKQQFTVTELEELRFAIRIGSGITVNNMVFRPMVRPASITDDTYEPYQDQTATITTGLPLCGIPVTEGGNVTIDGQQYIADTLEVNADGSGKVVKRTATLDLGSLTWTGANGKTGNWLYLIVELSGIGIAALGDPYKSPILCTSYPSITQGEVYRGIQGICLWKNGRLVVSDNRYSANYDQVGFKESLSGANLLYALVTPEEIPLTAAEVQSILSMQTFSPVTNVYNDEGAHQSVIYASNQAAVNERVQDSLDGISQRLVDQEVINDSVQEDLTQIFSEIDAVETGIGTENNKLEGDFIQIPGDNGPVITGLTLYGKSTQDGTPTPEAPVDIVSVGDDGSLVVTVSDGDTNIQTATLTNASHPDTPIFPLCGIPVEDGGNVTIDGQQYIADTLEVNADGSGKVVKRINRKVFDGTETWALQTVNKHGLSNFESPYYTQEKGLLSSHFKLQNTVIANTETEGMYEHGNIIFFRINSTTAATTEEFKAWIADNNVEVVGVAKEPTEIPLTAAEVQAILAMQTFSPVTNVYNDEGAYQEVYYATGMKGVHAGLKKENSSLKLDVTNLLGRVTALEVAATVTT